MPRLIHRLARPALIVALALGACGDDNLGRRADTGATDGTSVSDGTVTTTDTSVVPEDSAVVADTSVAPEDTAVTTADSVVADTVEPADATVDPDAPDVADTTETTPDVSEDVVEPPPKEVRFVVLGDTGEGNERQHKVAAAISSTCARLGCDFAILLGDNIYDAGVESVLDAQWQSKFEEPYKDIAMPFYAVLGNHDNGGLLSQIFGDTFAGAGAEFARGDFEVQYSSISTKWKMPGRTYQFEAGPARFFALDTNDMVWSLIDDSAESRADVMLDTLPGDIDESKATWKIAFGHHPYRSNGQHGNAGSYEGLEEGIGDLIAAIPFLGELGPVIQGKGVKDALDEIVCGRVDLYFAGHDHDRQWFVPETGACAGTTFVVSGAGSKLTDFKHEQATLFQDNQKAGFFWVGLVGKTLSVEAVSEDNETQWTHTVTKP